MKVKNSPKPPKLFIRYLGMDSTPEKTLEPQEVPAIGPEDKPIVKHERGTKKPLSEPFVYPDTQTGYNYFWNRKLIGKRKISPKRVVQNYLEKALKPSIPPQDHTYPHLADIRVAE